MFSWAEADSCDTDPNVFLSLRQKDYTSVITVISTALAAACTSVITMLLATHLSEIVWRRSRTAGFLLRRCWTLSGKSRSGSSALIHQHGEKEGNTHTRRLLSGISGGSKRTYSGFTRHQLRILALMWWRHVFPAWRVKLGEQTAPLSSPDAGAAWIHYSDELWMPCTCVCCCRPCVCFSRVWIIHPVCSCLLGCKSLIGIEWTNHRWFKVRIHQRGRWV